MGELKNKSKGNERIRKIKNEINVYINKVYEFLAMKFKIRR